MLEIEPPKAEIISGETARGLLPPARHRDDLDGIRALAAFWVVLSHLWIISFGLYAHDGWLGLATNWLLYSHFAVDIFIVLSGFCLMLPVARDGGLKGGAWAFFVRRARRILPPFYAALALSVLAGLMMQALEHHPRAVDGTALLVNLALLQDVFLSRNIFNGPFWSIAVEWRIYFLFPLMVWTMMRWGRSVALAGAALASVGMTVPLLRLHPDMMMASPWYLFLFVLGVCAGFEIGSGSSDRRKERRVWRPSLVVAALTLAALLRAHPVTTQGGADFGVYMPIMDVTVGVVTAAALLFLSRAAQPLAFLKWRPLVTLGTFAYSLYLIHMPCLLLTNHVLTACLPIPISPLIRVLILASSLPLIIGLAYLFFLTFERPFLRRRQAVSFKPPGGAFPG